MQRVPISDAQRDRIAASLPFVEALARRVAASMPHSIELGDLVQDGMIGLIDAAHRFDESRGIKFETFAERRVRGAMIDALRRMPGRAACAGMRRELEAAREDAAPRARIRAVARRSRRAGRRRRGAPRPHHRPDQHHRVDVAAGRPRRAPRDAYLPAVLAAVRAALAGPRLREASRCASASAPPLRCCPPRERKVIGLYYFRRSHDEADRRGDRRQRIARVAAARPRRAAAAARRSAPSDAAGHARACSAGGDARQMNACRRTACPAASRRVRGDRAALSDHVARDAQQIGEPERLGQPAAAAVFEKSLGLGAGDVAGDEDHPPRDARRRWRRSRGRTPVRPSAASAGRRRSRRRSARRRVRAPPRRRCAISTEKPASRSPSATAVGERGLRPRRRAPTRRHRRPLAMSAGLPRGGDDRRRRPSAAPRRNDAPLTGRRLHGQPAAMLLDDGVGDRQAEPGTLSDALGREERIEDLLPHARRARRVRRR